MRLVIALVIGAAVAAALGWPGAVFALLLVLATVPAFRQERRRQRRTAERRRRIRLASAERARLEHDALMIGRDR